MEVIVTILSKLGCFTYLGDVYPTYLYRVELIYFLSTMDIPVLSHPRKLKIAIAPQK